MGKLGCPIENNDYGPWQARLGVMYQLMENAASCHLCQFLTQSLNHFIGRTFPSERFDYAKRAQDVVYFHAILDSRGRLNAGVVVGEKGLELYRKGVYDTNFVIRFTSDLPGRGFDNYIGEERMPVYALDGVGRTRAWIDACSQEHECCQRFHVSTVDDQRQRPTRVLEVSEDSVRLCCNMSTQTFDYLVLSHMWGEGNHGQLRLLQENMADFQQKIPDAALQGSSTFVSAIAATRALGYRYLWIDSLCIIQDSDGDWKHEARRMAIVYGNAACNLAFLFPPDSSTSKFTTKALPNPPRDPRTWSPCLLPHPTASAPDSRPAIYIAHSTIQWRIEWFVTGDDHPWLVERNWPLFYRAWTFQEYLLAPRTLLLGAQNIMYHCSLHFYDELVGPVAANERYRGVNPAKPKGHFIKNRDKSRYFPDTLASIRDAESPSETIVLDFLADWHGVVNEYRGRELSERKDRIVAFAGIAKAYAHMGKLTYVAGLWLELLPLCLLWFVEGKLTIFLHTEYRLLGGEKLNDQHKTDEVVEPVTLKAPSWSWFSLPVYKFFRVGFWFGDDEMYIRAKSHLEPPQVCWDDIYWAEGEVYEYGDYEGTQQTDDKSAFFDFSDARITLTAYVLPVKANWPAEIEAQMQHIRQSSTCVDDHDLCFDPNFEYFPDIPMSPQSRPRKAIYVVLSEIQFVRPAGMRTIQRRLAGLMLTPGKEEGTWRRVGVWKLKLSIINVPVTNENMAEVAKRWREYDTLSSKWSYASIVLV